jgi:hypothetical protein
MIYNMKPNDQNAQLPAEQRPFVCMNGGNPDEATIAHKDPERAMKFEHSEKWREMSINHLEGRTAAFFCYGDEGGDEIDTEGHPKILRHKQYCKWRAYGFKRPFSPIQELKTGIRSWRLRFGHPPIDSRRSAI